MPTKLFLSSTTASQVLSGQTAVERVMSPMRSDGCSVSRAQSSFVVPACRMLFLQVQRTGSRLDTRMLPSHLIIQTIRLRLISMRLRLPDVFTAQGRVSTSSMAIRADSRRFRSFSMIPVSVKRDIPSLDRGRLTGF